MKTMRKLLKDARGVSQVISVLVLTAVVIVGAIGAGMIMNTFSNEVADSTSAAGIGTGAAAELLIAGSTTVQPLSECLAKEYMAKNKGVRVTVQGGGSDAGIASTGMNIVDIGAASKAIDDTILAKWPTLQAYEVGGSAVVVLTSDKCNLGSINILKSGLKALYNGSTTTLNGTTVDVVYQRADGSGTEETFAKWIGLQGADKQLAAASTVLGVNGNSGMKAAIESCGTTKCCIGFVDYGFAVDANPAKTDIPKLEFKTPSATNIKNELKTQDNTNFVKDLTRPLNYLTNGAPSSLENDFLTFAMSPASEKCVRETGVFAVWEYK